MAARPALVIKDANFLFGSPDLRSIGKQGWPEIAVVGRSNVGKSTFLNRLAQRRIARVSGIPGCTRELNFYKVQGEVHSRPFTVCLVDMPGFGYAKLSKSEREHISRLTVETLREREQIKAVLLLNDCRRLPEDDELAIQRICAEEGVACLVVITKVDALRASEKARSIVELAKAYHLEAGDVLTTGTDVSTENVWERLVTLID
jgi:GTP-binding protein